jgi:vacuolar-type H+-ATPase subunit I/STV1
MTAIGKIFAIINLLFSLVVAGFIVMIYVRSTNWAEAQKKWQASISAAEASIATKQQELDQEKASSAARVGDEQKRIKDLEDKVKGAEGDAKDARAALDTYKKANTGDQLTQRAMQAELDKRKEEVLALEKQVKEKEELVVKYVEMKNKAVDDKVAADIRATSYQARAERMESRIRETETEIARLRRSGGSGGTSGGISLVSAPNPPSQNVEGIITEKNGELLRISIGSDAGLEKGHTLDVYRLKPSPQYLGQIRLTDVRHNEAVGVPVDRLKYPAQKGDFVSSDVTAKK